VRDSLRLGRIAGFPVSMNWSVLVILLLLAWGLADGVLPESAPGHSDATYWFTGITGAGLLLCSLLAHEVAHAVVARRSGVEVDGLTLWMFGGLATLRGEAPTPGADFRIAVVGPATSLGLGVGFGAAWLSLGALGVSALAVSVAGWLASINVTLAVFNLIPGAPLDGGRVLRALLWRRWGDRTRAAATATKAGQVGAYALVALGLLALLAGDTVGGLWTVLIGWFLMAAARAEYLATLSEGLLHGVVVADVMSTGVETGDADASIEDFVNTHVLRGRHSAYPVVGPTGVVEGLVSLGQLRSVPTSLWRTTSVREVAVPLARVATCAPTDPADALLTRVTRESGGRALVFDGGRLVGIVTPADVTRALETLALYATAHGHR
jgi:Zn-dependent protease